MKDAKAAGKTVIFSSHILSEVEEVCDRVVILRGGRWFIRNSWPNYASSIGLSPS